MALSDASILITGESGTGKELFSQAIHNASRRRAKPFVAINCAAIPESLLESELFGYDEGAFTGAKKGGKPGLFEIAHEGTVFLDEIGEMPLALQARLLRVLQEKCVMRVGGNRLIDIDVRVIAATNRNLKDEVRRQTFRKDLYYRLNVLPMVLPTLREHSEDVPELIAMMQKRLGATFSIGPALMTELKRYEWDGNIRELQNLIAYLYHLDKPVVSFQDLPYGTELNGGAEAAAEDLPDVLKIDDYRYGYVLWFVYRAGRDRRRIGRRTLRQRLDRAGYVVSEREVRTILGDLAEWGYLRIRSGRAGTEITAKGIALIENGTKAHIVPFLMGSAPEK
jgi:transcriptional regulator with PAS, ATPase and Fis domain